jgi:hypothetical protein
MDGSKMEKKAWEDTSILQGIAQYFDDRGVEWRRENDGVNFNFYENDGIAFLFRGILKRKVYDCSIYVEHRRFLENVSE